MSAKRLCLLLVTLLPFPHPAHAQLGRPEPEPLVDQVRRSLDRGVEFLRKVGKEQGHWEIDVVVNSHPGANTSMALLALLNAGVPPEDELIQRGLRHLRTVEPRQTYVVGLQTMAFAEAGQPEDWQRIQRNVDWLLAARVYRGKEFTGWSYTQRSNDKGADNSNTQYALLGLHAGKQAGARIDKQVWEEIRDFYLRTQKGAGWDYSAGFTSPITLTMTTAGFCGLHIAGMELSEGQQRLNPITGVAEHCGQYKENEAVQLAQKWIGDHFRLRGVRSYVFYNLYGIERAGRLSGQRFFGEHDWYRHGCEYLVEIQRENGAWFLPSQGFDSFPVVSTSFALLFLSKGRTPVLISKLVHGPRDNPGTGWNNKHHDARNVVAFASQELFKRQPLAWQVFDARRVRSDTLADRLTLVGDLLQSPIVYFNGHDEPRFTGAEEDMLQRYVEEGGFIFAEACCGKPEFDRGFRALMRRLFPDNELKPLLADHPIWQAHFLVPPDAFPLEGVEIGCKTMIVYSPRPISGWWEENLRDQGKGQLAFRLAGNLIAYATGLETPKPRLTKVEVKDIRDDARDMPRGYLKVAQLIHGAESKPAPRAMRNLMLHLREDVKLDVVPHTEDLRPSHRDLLNFKFMYMHGRQRFNLTEPDLKNLRANLQTGGLLFADACCGKREFDASFRAMIHQLFPDRELEMIPLTDELYSADLNGEPIAKVRCRRERADGQGAEAEMRDVAPYLEGIKINDRWVVIYSKYDIGCALEKHQSAGCLGHDYDSAARLGRAVVLYALMR
ncbi:MAG: DUF4159 domain-containing protein [Gemmataceae bacterium]